jgi:hypothetical protein
MLSECRLQFSHLVGSVAALSERRKNGSGKTAVIGRYNKLASNRCDLAYALNGVEVIRFYVRQLLPMRPCVSTGAVERVNVSFVRSSWAWRC